jgi:ribosome maturation factor RimP
MNSEAQIQALEHKVEALISTEPDLFLVEVSIKPTNNIKVFIDGDQGVSIDKLVRYNRSLYKHIEEEGMFPNGDFSLEVSSPGLEEPLKLHRQYIKNIGRFVEVVLIDGSKTEGKLTGATETDLLIEETKARLTNNNKNKEAGQGKGKKMPARMSRSDGETVQHTISFDNIKTTKIKIKF